MKNIIKRSLIPLFLSLLTPTIGMSQTTFDSIEVKTIALICAEHEKLSIENSLLKEENESLDKLNQLYMVSDSIQWMEIRELQKQVLSDGQLINQLEKEKKSWLKSSVAGGIVLFILGLIL